MGERRRLAKGADGGRAADGAIGVLSGMLGSATGLGGILPTVWCGLRGWSKDEQRAVFQPVAVAIFAMTALWLGGAGMVGAGPRPPVPRPAPPACPPPGACRCPSPTPAPGARLR